MISKHTYSEEIFSKVENFIAEKTYQLEHEVYSNEDEIKILCPNWLLDAYAHYLNSKIFNFNYLENKGARFFMGKEILPHYKNEIVVYYTRFLENKQSKYFTFDLEVFLLNEKEG